MGQYDIKVKKYHYAKSHFYLETEKGLFILRKTIATKEQIQFEYELGENMLAKGFPYINPIFLTKKKTPYVVSQDKVYVLQPYLVGEEIDFQNAEDLKQAIIILANFHQLAKDMAIGEKSVDEMSFKNPYEAFHKRYVESQRLRKSIGKTGSKTPFETMYIKDYKVYQSLQEMALEKIDCAMGEKLTQMVKEHQTVAHNDYSYHTVEKNKDGEFKMTELDSCGYGIQITDIANVLTKVMQKNNWNITLLHDLLNSYESQRTLSSEERNMLKALLIFPGKYAKICNNYLNSKRRNNYTMFEMKWENMLVYQKEQVEAAHNIYHYL